MDLKKLNSLYLRYCIGERVGVAMYVWDYYGCEHASINFYFYYKNHPNVVKDGVLRQLVSFSSNR